MKTSLYNQDGSLCSEAQFLLSSKPDEMSLGEWRKKFKEFKSSLSIDDVTEFEGLRKNGSSARWRAENHEKIKQDNAKWRAENYGHYNNYYKRRRSEDPLFRLQHNMRSACNRVVKQLSLGKKPASTFKWIGCSHEELKAHLESLFTEGMTWENYGEWHVDHIRPICSFAAEEWEQVNHYTNLQPLWAEDNLAKIVFDKRQTVNKKTPTAL